MVPMGKDKPESTKRLSVKMPESLWAELKIQAVRDRFDLGDLIVAALAAYLKNKTPPTRLVTAPRALTEVSG
jgi:hypothetical protein